eukprot:COSAG04_NODE_14764_length_556_cov_0.636761_1_plen_99_part_10
MVDGLPARPAEDCAEDGGLHIRREGRDEALQLNVQLVRPCPPSSSCPLCSRPTWSERVAWVRRPEGGQEVKQPALTFSKGDQIIVTNSEGVDVRTGFWE